MAKGQKAPAGTDKYVYRQVADFVTPCFKVGSLDKGGYEHLIRGLDEAGRMVGGWIKQQGQK